MNPLIDGIALLCFDTSGWRYHGIRDDQSRLWESPDNDAVSLYFFEIAPNIPRCSTVQELRQFYADAMKSSGAEIVEFGVTDVAGHPTISFLLKAPMKPFGFMYQGTFTLPFRDFSFVVKVQCLERGTTGIRETILFHQRLKAGEQPSSLVSGKPPFPDWNPDSPAHDAEFPMHPVSRLRRLLGGISKSASLDDKVRNLPGFVLPKA